MFLLLLNLTSQNRNIMRMKVALSVAVLFVVVCSHAQLGTTPTFYNNGAVVFVANGAQMAVKTGTNVEDGTFQNDSGGLFVNRGEVHIEGNFKNVNGAAVDSSSSGQYFVDKDWENSATFVASQSEVHLHGNNQLITGTSITTFYDLICENSGTVKSQTIDANVAGTLALNGNELATNDNTLRILNPSASAIVTNGGDDAFVSSTGAGRLVRNTNSTGVYLFPVGWNDGGTYVKREVAITPGNTSDRNYAVRFALNMGSSTTTSDDGYDIAVKQAAVQTVNNKFYHLVASSDNAPADLGIYFDPVLDGGAWNSIGRWQDAPQWTDLGNTTVAVNIPRSVATRANWLDNNSEPHALVQATEGGNDYAFPNVFIAGSNDPTVPAENTVFTIVNNLGRVVLDELMVFNRWGEMVFNSKRDGTNTWNGFYQGKLQQQGNYTFLAKMRRVSGENIPPVSGNLTLIW